MRITVDLDEPTKLEIRQSWNRLRNYGDGDVFGRVSSSGMGCHLKVHGFDGDLEDTVLPRLWCGDDTRRAYYDMDWNLKPKQIMFGSKPADNNHAGDWRESLDHLLADYHLRAPARIKDGPAPKRYRNRL